MGSGIRSQEKRLGGTATNFNFNFNSVYTSIYLYIKKLKLKLNKKENKKQTKKYQTDNATYNSLVSIYNTFYFPLCCHVDTCFFFKKDLHIFFSYFIRITVTLSCICFLNCSHLYKQQLKLRTQNSNQISEIRNQQSEIRNQTQTVSNSIRSSP